MRDSVIDDCPFSLEGDTLDVITCGKCNTFEIIDAASYDLAEAQESGVVSVLHRLGDDDSEYIVHSFAQIAPHTWRLGSISAANEAPFDG